MYHNGQVVHDRDKNEPCIVGDPKDESDWAWDNLPKRTVHYIRSRIKIDPPKDTYINLNGETYKKANYTERQQYEIALPESVEEAKELLMKGIISPAPCASTHCWKCGHWLTVHTQDCEFRPK
jgi:hypothetical protein